MNVDVEGDEEINLIKDGRARSNTCYNVVKGDTFGETVGMMVISQLILNRHRMDNHLQNLMTQW